MSDTSKCRGCTQDIKWIKSVKSGKSIPCDPVLIRVTQEQAGNITIVMPDGSVVKRNKVGDEGYISHFVTCPKAQDFRKVKVAAQS